MLQSDLITMAADHERGEAGDLGSVGGKDHGVETSSENTHKIIAAISEQGESLKTLFESAIKAIEAIGPKPKSRDKKIAFWTAYNTLAEEFDKEFKEKYKDDLDTSLIFCLFSAVSSAFIIQIQPELQPDPNGPTQILLSLLVQNITGLPPTLLPPSTLVDQSSAPPTLVVIAQGLLYFSLFATLMASLLAVLGKQWLLYYSSVGQHGTVAERGVERQRKFDGMRRWRFNVVMQIFPLLLQLSLLLFATALSIYLWTIHHIIAGTVFVLTALGVDLTQLSIGNHAGSASCP
ncbi:hypothetical protein MSAN_01986100 [Mycena sanguinolenta]|uniref:DUF6535 domain-containing protein n=1 Tax=Mycena sanguinolenta TaxID=230812 RepID=A0A8H6XM98_9AGAR|nr:hypothetical protein MSAN_01986100 [Mycena sanguinolenta]